MALPWALRLAGGPYGLEFTGLGQDMPDMTRCGGRILSRLGGASVPNRCALIPVNVVPPQMGGSWRVKGLTNGLPGLFSFKGRLGRSSLRLE